MAINISTGQKETNQSDVAKIVSAKNKVSELTQEKQSQVLASSSQLTANLQELDLIKQNINGLGFDVLERELDSVITALRNGLEDVNKILDDNAADFTDLSNILTRNSEAVFKASNVATTYNKVLAEGLKHTKKLSDEQRKDYKSKLKAQMDYNKKSLELFQKREKERIKEEQKALAESLKSERKAFASTAKNFAESIGKAFSLTKLNDIANQLNAQSSKTILQRSLMQNYDMQSNREFNSFKKELFSSVNTSLYSTDQILNAMQLLNTNYAIQSNDQGKLLNQLIQGQNLLGLSADTQESLMKLSTKTGRDELSFYQDTMAKYIVSDLKLSRAQADELVKINSNLVSSATGYGITSEAYRATSMSEQAALKASGLDNAAELYSQSQQTLLGNQDATAALLGMSTQDLSDYLNSGQEYLKLLLSGGNSSAVSELKSMWQSGQWTQAKQYLQPAFSLDDSTMELLRQLFENENKIMQNLGTATELTKAEKGSDEYYKQLTDQYGKTVTWLAKTGNSISNFFTQTLDWQTDDLLSQILALVAIIAGSQLISNTKSFFSDGFKLLKNMGGQGTSWLGGSGSGLGKLFGAGSTLGGTTGVSKWSWGNGALSKLSKFGAVTAGIGMGIDAFQGYNTTSKEMYGENATTGQKIGAGVTAALSGSNVYKNSEGKVSVGMNGAMGALSGAGKGAAIGGLFGPLGMAIGAGVGGLFGGIAGLFKGSKAREEERKKQEALDNIEKNTQKIEENSKNATAKIGLLTSYRDIRSVAAGSVGLGGVSTPAGIGSSPSEAGSPYPWKVTAGYPKYPGGSPHNGMDFGVGIGTKIGAVIGGTVTKSQDDNVNTYYAWKDGKMDKNTALSRGSGVWIKGDDGNSYVYWHMSQTAVKKGDRVEAGTLLGYSGESGFATGPHLHFGVMRNGSYVEPADYVTNGLFTASGASYSQSSSSSDSVSSALSTTSNPDMSTYKLRTAMGSPSEITTPIVGSITNLRDTIVSLQEKVNSQEKLMNILTGNRPQPTI